MTNTRIRRHRWLEQSPMHSLALCILVSSGFLAIGMTNPPDTATPPASPASADQNQSTSEKEGLHECVITLITGRKITGFLMESREDEVVLRLEGIDTTYRRKTIDSIRFLPPILQRYREIRETIEDSDIETRLVLVEWLRTRQAYSLAMDELASIRELAPHNIRAKTLHNWLKARLELSSKTKAKPNSKKNNHSRPTRTNSNTIPTLTKDQINLMRIYELDLRNPPKMVVPDETLKTLMARHPSSFPIDTEDRKAYLQIPEHEKLKLLFTHRARDLYPEVTILEDPAMMRTFKTTVHARNGWIVNACASTRCHGGSEAGDFRLINSKPNSDATAYTNFYIINNYRLDDGTPLIDFANPARSPLLQMGTRNANSLRPHPQVALDRPGSRYRPIFRSSRDRKYQQAVDWINSIYKPRIEYDLGYPPPPTSPTSPTEDDKTGDKAPSP